MEKPDVDHIEGLSPAISISRNRRLITRVLRWGQSPKSTLFAFVVRPRWRAALSGPRRPLAAQTVSQMVDNVLSQPEGSA